MDIDLQNLSFYMTINVGSQGTGFDFLFKESDGMVEKTGPYRRWRLCEEGGESRRREAQHLCPPVPPVSQSEDDPNSEVWIVSGSLVEAFVVGLAAGAWHDT